LLLYVD